MKKVKLISLKYENFKGGSEALAFDGHNTTIYGTNRSGKTRALDAWDYLLTERDSSDSATFGIKPVEGLKVKANVTVEAIIEIDGRRVELKKEYAEKWTTKRGYSQPEFTGHTTEYFVDGAPLGQKGFVAWTDKNLVEFELLPCFTNLRYFNERLDCVPTEGKKKKLSPQEARRLVLISIFGDVSDADVIASDPEFKRLPEMLKEKTAAAYRAELEYQKGKLNSERTEIPSRIDELQKSLPEKTADAGALANDKADIESRLSVLRNQLSMIESGGSAGAKKSELLDVQNKIREIEQGIRKKHDEEAARLRGVVRFCQEAYDGADKKVEGLKTDLTGLDFKIASHAKAMADLTAKWHTENERQFSGSGVCPTCGQEIPAEKREEAIAEFNKAKADTLAKINSEGKAIKAQKEESEAQKGKLSAEVAGLEGKLPGLKADLDNAKGAVEKQPDWTPGAGHQALLDRATAIESELSEIAMGLHDEASGIHSEIAEETAKLAEVDKALAEIEAAKKTSDRIEELTAREKAICSELERMEKDLFLMEDFTRAKCRMLTDQINSHFKITRWQMFENQVNGGLKDVCIAMTQNNSGQWVPYPDLNTESRINSSIDCINTLARAYGLEMPIWVDDSDLVVETIPTSSQTIKLVVSAEDKALRVEADTDKNITKAA